MGTQQTKLALPSLKPDIRLLGAVTDDMLRQFLEGAGKLESDRPAVVELSTMGGDAETARRIAEEIRLLASEREVFLLGKTYVFSAGITILAARPPTHRFLTRDTVLLVHERQFERTVNFNGALRSAIAHAKNLLAEMEIGSQLEQRGFRQFCEGSALTEQQLTARVLEKDWYMTADEALELKLAAGLVP